MTEEKNRHALIALNAVKGIGPRTAHGLINYFGSPCEVFGRSEGSYPQLAGVRKSSYTELSRGIDMSFVRCQLDSAEKLNVRILSYMDEEYPDILREIYDPPVIIYIAGEYFFSDRSAVAIVGTRRATLRGRRAAGDISRGLAAAGFTVVSGLASGIDTAAHEGALAAGGRSGGVMGCGLDRIYPSCNRGLAERMCLSGFLISEYPFFTPPDANNFPRRNRIISALSRGVLVVESGEKGGALITVDFAAEQNRDLFAVPGPVDESVCRGTNELLKNGARPVTCASDIIFEYTSHSAIQETAVRRKPELSGIEMTISRAMEEGAVSLEDISEKSGLTIQELLAGLLTMEIKGYVSQMPGRCFKLNFI
ncbi:MAG: DNA-processing protein DprA [Fibrobacterota bacterium]